MRFTNSAAASRQIAVVIGGTGFFVPILRVTIAASTTYVDPDTDALVLQAGESLAASYQGGAGPAANDVSYSLSGAELLN